MSEATVTATIGCPVACSVRNAASAVTSGSSGMPTSVPAGPGRRAVEGTASMSPSTPPDVRGRLCDRLWTSRASTVAGAVGSAGVDGTAYCRHCPQPTGTLLELHALRQRQLRTAFLHGRRRAWRERRRIWPAVVVALALIALLVAGASVVRRFSTGSRK